VDRRFSSIQFLKTPTARQCSPQDPRPLRSFPPDESWSQPAGARKGEKRGA